jgi:hypothetical protein
MREAYFAAAPLARPLAAAPPARSLPVLPFSPVAFVHDRRLSCARLVLDEGARVEVRLQLARVDRAGIDRLADFQAALPLAVLELDLLHCANEHQEPPACRK